MSCNLASSFPTVATVIGLSPESLRDSGTYVATIAVDPDAIMSNVPMNNHPPAIKADDPITQALVDNINGNLPTKKEPEVLRCEICNVSVSKQVVMDAHLVGTKHAKKLKSLELLKEIDIAGSLPFPTISNTKPNQFFSCKICNIGVNSSHQLHAHLQGNKHKAKAETSESNTTYVPASKVGIQTGVQGSNISGMVGIDVSANRLYCAACNIHVNSDIQLHQHITSRKHLDKVNGKAPQQPQRGQWTQQQRNTPYQRPSGQFNKTSPRQGSFNPPPISNNFVSSGHLYEY